MKRESYLDWVPCATNAVSVSIVQGEIDPDDILRITKSERDAIDQIIFLHRNDGLLLFCVNWKMISYPSSTAIRLGIAHEISFAIKSKVGHHHVFNTERDGRPKLKPFPTITVNPIELDDHVRSDDYSKFRSDEFILSLQSKDLFPDNNKTRSRIAVFVLRSQYARVFEKAKNVQWLLRQQRLVSTALSEYFELHQPMLFKFCSNFKFMNVRRYDWFWVIVLFAVSAGIVFLLEILLLTSLDSGDNYIISRKVFERSFRERMQLGVFVVAILLYIQQISLKRRKILQALSRARGYLLHGDIFNEIIGEMLPKANAGHLHQPMSFSGSIKIIDEIMNLEKAKRSQAQFILISMALIGSHQFTGLIKKFPPIDSVISIYNLITGLSPLH